MGKLELYFSLFLQFCSFRQLEPFIWKLLNSHHFVKSSNRYAQHQLKGRRSMRREPNDLALFECGSGCFPYMKQNHIFQVFCSQEQCKMFTHFPHKCCQIQAKLLMYRSKLQCGIPSHKKSTWPLIGFYTDFEAACLY